MTWLLRGLAVLAGIVILIQFIPYGRDHANPPVVAEPSWDSTQTRDLTVRACFDCHSNETEWPWYSNIAPVSWAVQRDVDEGRDKLNFSEWHLEQDGDEAAETVRDRSMPPRQYVLMHSQAALDDEESELLAAGLAATLGDKESDDDD